VGNPQPLPPVQVPISSFQKFANTLIEYLTSYAGIKRQIDMQTSDKLQCRKASKDEQGGRIVQ